MNCICSKKRKVCKCKRSKNEGKIVYFMRGLASAGKSTRAKEIVANAPTAGVVLEVDHFFDVVNPDGIVLYNYDASKVDEAREYVKNNLIKNMKAGVHPIVIDRGNNPSPYVKELVQLVIKAGYTPEIAEPQTEWWQECRVLIKYKDMVAPALLDKMAKKLADLNKGTHRVSYKKIRARIKRWRYGVTIQDYLDYEE